MSYDYALLSLKDKLKSLRANPLPEPNIDRKRKPKAGPEIGTLDCETDPFKVGRIPKNFLWGVYIRSTYYEFTEPAQVAGFLMEECKGCILYAHNGGKFEDFHALIPFANLHEPITIINGRLVKFMIGECELRDSLAILPVALEKYKKQKINYAIFEPEVRDRPEN